MHSVAERSVPGNENTDCYRRFIMRIDIWEDEGGYLPPESDLTVLVEQHLKEARKQHIWPESPYEFAYSSALISELEYIIELLREGISEKTVYSIVRRNLEESEYRTKGIEKAYHLLWS